MSGEGTEIDRRLATLADDFAAGADDLSAHPVLRRGVVQAATNEVIWALYRAFPDERHDLADHLDDMGGIVRDQAFIDDRKADDDAEPDQPAIAEPSAPAPPARPGELPLR